MIAAKSISYLTTTPGKGGKKKKRREREKKKFFLHNCGCFDSDFLF